MQFHFSVDGLLASLPYMAKGMIGIFLVVAVIIFATWALGIFCKDHKTK
ncbi:MAG: hypothetical protein SOV91_00015 [Eubacteriales bacterium]|nr:hypothetical protein [Eubacteriales bacterium]